jgi:hypothetical protein
MQVALNVKTGNLGWLSFPLMLPLLGGGIYFLIENPNDPVIGGAMIAISFVIPLLFWATGQYETRLLINDFGIQDERLGVGLIPWGDIIEARIERKYNNNFLCLKVRSPEKLLARLAPGKRARYEANHDLGFTHFNVSITGINVDDLDLLEMVRQKSLSHAKLRSS